VTRASRPNDLGSNAPDIVESWVFTKGRLENRPVTDWSTVVQGPRFHRFGQARGQTWREGACEMSHHQHTRVCVERFLERTAERRFRCVDLGVRMGGGALGLVRISLDGQAGTRGAAERRFSAAKRREAERRSKFPQHTTYCQNPSKADTFSYAAPAEWRAIQRIEGNNTILHRMEDYVERRHSLVVRIPRCGRGDLGSIPSGVRVFVGFIFSLYSKYPYGRSVT
jgi:hypothetical protein